MQSSGPSKVKGIPNGRGSFTIAAGPEGERGCFYDPWSPFYAPLEPYTDRGHDKTAGHRAESYPRSCQPGTDTVVDEPERFSITRGIAILNQGV